MYALHRGDPPCVVLPSWPNKLERAHWFEAEAATEVWHDLLLLVAVQIPML